MAQRRWTGRRGNKVVIVALWGVYGSTHVHGFVTNHNAWQRGAGSVAGSVSNQLLSHVDPASLSSSSSLDASHETAKPRPRRKKARKSASKKPGSASSRTAKASSSSNSNNNNTRQRSIEAGMDPLKSLNMNLDHLAKSGEEGSAERAYELLDRIEALYKEGYYDVQPDTVSYNAVLNAHAMSSSSKSLSPNKKDNKHNNNKALDLLEKMVSSPDIAKPNIVSYNTVLRASSHDAEQAELILQMIHDDPNQNVQPNTITYNSIMHAWAQTPHGASKAEAYLREMMALHHERQSDDDGTLKADTIAFNTVLNAWATTPDSADRAEALLEHMERLYQAGNVHVRPDVYSYASVMKAWASPSTKNRQVAAQKALALLERMERMYQETGNPDIRPNAITYTSVMNVLARSPAVGSAQQAQELLEIMLDKYRKEGREDLKPDTIVFSSVMDAWAKCTDDQAFAAERALEVLQTMLDCKESGELPHLQPNARTYCSVIYALGRSRAYGAAERAHRLLDDMERRHAFGRHDDAEAVAPNTWVYNAVIDGYARSSYIGKAEKAYILLRKMEMESVENNNPAIAPDVITYNNVLNACCNAFGDATFQQKAFVMALQTFKTLHRAPHIRQTSVTYSLFLKCIRKLAPAGNERNIMLRKTFSFCASEGLVNQVVLNQLKTACDRETFYDILTHCGTSIVSTDVTELPQSWRRNAKR
jgi:hypothetical protein